MNKIGYFVLGLIFITSSAFCAVLQQNDFTPAENGTLPSNLAASYDQGTDVIVVPLASMNPAPPVDHPGGDGYVLRVGDIGPGGGAWNWAYPDPGITETNCKVSAWVYVDWTTWDSPPLERDYLLALRMQTQNPNSGATYRQGYMFVIAANSSWTGISPNPTSKRPFIMKRVGTTYTMIGSEGATDIETGWHYVVFEAVGDQLKGYVDGQLVCSGTDTTYTSGYCAIGYYEDNGLTINYPYAAAFDNFSFESVNLGVDGWMLY